jgi:hypothetical protein
MQIRFPGESADYRAARDRLLEREIELRRAMEAVAAARRALPPGGAVPEDYVFAAAGPDGMPIQVRLSELFAPGNDSLVIYNFMFPRGYKGTASGAGQRRNGTVAAGGGPVPVLRRAAGSARRRRSACQPAAQPRRPGEAGAGCPCRGGTGRQASRSIRPAVSRRRSAGPAVADIWQAATRADHRA